MEEIKVIDLKGQGFRQLYTFEGWKIAGNGFKKGVNDMDSVASMGKHRLTAEAFLLLEGEGYLVTAGTSKMVGDMAVCRMERGKLYLIPQEMWHFLALSERGLALIVENSDTSTENSKTVCLTKDQSDMARRLLEEARLGLGACRGKES